MDERALAAVLEREKGVENSREKAAPDPSEVKLVLKTLLGCAEKDARLQLLCFRVIRLYLKRMVRKGTESLFESKSYAYYLNCIESDNCNEKVRAEALTCIGNSLYLNVNAFKNFNSKENNGMERIITLFNSAASAKVLHRCARILNLCVQDYAVVVDQKKSLSKQFDEVIKRLSTYSITLLCYCVRSKNPSPFPGNGKSRVSLVLEIMSLQLLLGSRLDPAEIANQTGAASVMFTELGMALVELLLLPIDMEYMFEVKCKVLNMLTFMPEQYSNFLAANKAFGAVLEVLERQIHAIVINGHSDFEIRLMPALVVLSTASKVSVVARDQLDKFIFIKDPNPPPPPTTEEETKKRQMEPDYAPPGTLISFLIKMMANPSHAIAKLTGDLLFSLCEENSGYFIKRTGLGNAIGYLQQKGLFSIPGMS